MKTALVTGGSRGIGKAVSTVLGKNYHVVVGYVTSEDKAAEVVSEIKESGGSASSIDVNISSKESVDKAFATIEKSYGSVDILINNAGITKDTLMLRMNEEDFDSVINVNLKSVFNTTKHAQRLMLKQRSGSIINISSIVGLKGNAGQANYAASKAGIIGFTKSVALELGSRGIRCNAVAPGFIETEMTAVLDEKTVQSWRDAIPLKRGGKPEDVANACIYLASDLSSYVSGQVLQVDGGLLT